MDTTPNGNPILKNGDTLLELYEYDGRYALLTRLNVSPSAEKFIVAVGIEIENGMCTWEQGRYFNDKNLARQIYADYISGNTTAYVDWVDRQKAQIEN